MHLPYVPHVRTKHVLKALRENNDPHKNISNILLLISILLWYTVVICFITLTEIGADGLHHCSRNLRMSLLPVPVLHGVPSVQKHQREKVVLTCYDKGSSTAL